MGYPNSLDAIEVGKRNDTDAVTGANTGFDAGDGDHANHHNALATAINAIEAELGLNPSAAHATVAEFLAALQTQQDTFDVTPQLAAIPVGDKLIWKLGGNTIVEVWGEEASIPVAGFTTFVSDDFATNDLATIWDNGSSAVFTGNYFGTNLGAIQRHSPDIMLLPNKTLPRTADVKMQGKFKWQTDGGERGFEYHQVGTSTSDITKTLQSKMVWIGGAQVILRIEWPFGGVTIDSAPFTAPVTDAVYWLKCSKVGSLVSMEYWTTDPALGGAAAQTVSSTLTGAGATTYGAGVQVGAGLFGDNMADFIGAFRMQDKANKVVRRLQVAVTNPTSTRVEKSVLAINPDGSVYTELV